MAAEFKLQTDPAERLLFSGKLGEEPVPATVVFTNPLKERVAIKVKCTSNEMFRIRPPLAKMNPDEKLTVVVTFNAGSTPPDSGRHYIVIYYVKAEDEKMSPRQAFQNKADPDGSKKIFIDFKTPEGVVSKAEGEGAEANLVKKEEEKKVEEKKEEPKKEEEKKEEKKEGEGVIGV